MQLYSFRRCPYAIRARWALKLCGIPFQVCEVDLKNKPKELLSHSPKGTVPVLILPDGQVLDESMDIVRWAFSQGIPGGWGDLDFKDPEACAILDKLHHTFIPSLNRFKYAVRHQDVDIEHEKRCLLEFMMLLDQNIEQGLCGALSWIDIACLPFIRQAYKANNEWFDQQPCVRLKKWLEDLTETNTFVWVMRKD